MLPNVKSEDGEHDLALDDDQDREKRAAAQAQEVGQPEDVVDKQLTNVQEASEAPAEESMRSKPVESPSS